MKLSVARVLTYGLVALALAGAVRFAPRLPDPDRRAGELLVTEAATPSWKLRFDTLGRGESLHSLLKRGGLTDEDASRALQAASTLDERRIPAGMPVTIKAEAADSAPNEVTLQLSIDRLLHLRRDSTGWKGTEEKLAWATDTIVVGGSINTNLYDAINSSAKTDLPNGARQQLAWSLADVYEYRVDMSRDLQKGDEFKVVAERSVAPTGATRIGRVIAATFKLSGSIVDAVHFSSEGASGDYFDQTGRSMRAAFRRAPLEFRRISSVFGAREHPILGGIRMHKGLDYAADYGTPVRAVGDGVVVRKGWGNGYGNVLEIRHRNGFITRYGHLSRYAPGIHVGSRVARDEYVANVGSTGLSTGPHLHFEVIVNGEQRDPRIALNQQGGDPIPTNDRLAFDQLRDKLLAQLDAPLSGVMKLALH
ncbi:MAG TPA: M23 family metallopeptidase [Gemmatimonadaceae bacterium]|nr:M23 family metallopeptidase [Gemmatimonadaceae bacterium]